MNIRFFTGDTRLNERAEYCEFKLSEHPDRSFPQIFPDSADLEGFYRLLNNPRVSHQELISSICSQCLDGLPDKEILFIHDTTLIEPDPKSKTGKGFGRLNGRGKGRKGFLAHISLAVGLESKPIIHGLAGAFLWIRKGQPYGWEGKRWHSQIEAIEKELSPSDKKIHIMDREADVYPLFYRLQKRSTRFVIRISYDRCLVKGEHKKLHAALQSAPIMGQRDVFLSKRVKCSFFKQNKYSPSRSSRKATLSVSAKRVILDGSYSLKHAKEKDLPLGIEANIVRVFEKKTSKKHPPVEWYLITSEPIETLEQIWKVVDFYRRRWVIEEVFKALKTGCRLESRLFATLESWEKLVSLYLPIACDLFNLKNLSLPPLKFFTRSQWAILKTLARQESLPLESMEEAQLLVARLGGHIKYTGPPGWLVLARGYHELISMEVGWKMRRDK